MGPPAVTAWLSRALAGADALAEDWLGFAEPPAERAIATSGWAPDARGAYCARCGDSLGPGEASDGCASCRGRRAIGDGVVRLGPYAPPLREWILAVKYERRWREMGEALGRRLGWAVAGSRVVAPARTVVVPVPMPALRRLARGIDHAAVIAGAAATVLGAPMVAGLRMRPRPVQAARSRAERARSGRRGIRPARRWRSAPGAWAGVDVVLVDDVRTTGATLAGAAAALRPLRPRRIVLAVLAVAGDPARRPPGRSRGSAPGRPDEAVRGETGRISETVFSPD